MAGREQLAKLGASLMALGPRRLAALAAVGIAVFATIGVGSHYLGRAEMETLYVGLTPQDLARVGVALQEAGIRFDANPEGNKVFVPRGQAQAARAVLVEKGLPLSANAGYELFDKLGSMSLTSFMQNITRLRALEGEIARTVQAMKGVKAARVHIVLPDAGSFRRAAQPPSASVLVRTDGALAPSAQAIRHLVAAAIPGLGIEQVSVLSTDGAVLAAGGDGGTGTSSKMLDLEKSVSKDIQDSVRRTLAPILGFDNFEVSVAARLNIDKRQTSETAFDPETKVERSVRVVKESGNAQNAGRSWSTSVEQNIPADTAAAPAGGEQSKRTNDRREELTNFELGTKSVATTSEGYRIENIAVAVVVNRKRPGAATTPEALSAETKQIEQLVGSAAGLDARRGDKVTVAALDFFGGLVADEAAPGLLARLGAHVDTFITAAAVLVACGMLILFVLRPALRAIAAEPRPALLAAAPASATGAPPAVAATMLGSPYDSGPAAAPPAPVPSVMAMTQKRLEDMVAENEEQAAAVLKQWLRA